MYVDGCFWHGCPEHGVLPRANREKWRSKLEANRARDEAVTRALEIAGWRVLRFWEHEDPEESAREVASVVSARRSQSR